MTKRKTPSDSGYCLGPFNIDDDAWYYVELACVRVVAQLRDSANNYQGTLQTCIPWNDVRNALAIKDHRRRTGYRAARRDRRRAK